MRTGRAFRAASLLGSFLSCLSGCGGPPEAPVAGTLQVTLSSPNPDDGALLFRITGGPVDSVEAAGYALYSSPAAGNTLDVIVTGDLRPGTIARVHIPDERLVSQYAATVTQAAARTSYTLRDPAGYGLTLGE